MPRRHETVTPRNGHTLVVGVVARISGCANQKEVSLDDQLEHAKEEVAAVYDGPPDAIDYRVIATKGKGERLDRPELADIEAMIRTRELDLLIFEDVGRLVRGPAAADLVGLAYDHGTRVISPNDGIDTINDDFYQDVLDACSEHVGHNAHASKRIKHKLMTRFKRNGGVPAQPIAGYIVSPGVKTYDEWLRDEAATPVYREWFARLRRDRSWQAVADWLNDIGFPVGPYCRPGTTRWTAVMVKRVTRNTLLKGYPYRGALKTVKHFETGRRVPVRNPDGPVYRHCPHLAHIDPDEFDAVNAVMDGATRGRGRRPADGREPRAGFPSRRTRFPGQHVLCWYCRRLCVWGATGRTTR